MSRDHKTVISGRSLKIMPLKLWSVDWRQTDRHTDRQTDTQTDTQTDRHGQKHNLLGGGNELITIQLLGFDIPFKRFA